VFQAVFAKGLVEALQGRMPRQFAHQARHLRGTTGQQRLDDMHADKTVGAGNDDLAAVARTVLGQHPHRHAPLRIAHGLAGRCAGQHVICHQQRERANRRHFEETVQCQAAPKPFADAQQQRREQNRMAAEVEEAVVDRQLRHGHLQQFAPQICQLRL